MSMIDRLQSFDRILGIMSESPAQERRSVARDLSMLLRRAIDSLPPARTEGERHERELVLRRIRGVEINNRNPLPSAPIQDLTSSFSPQELVRESTRAIEAMMDFYRTFPEDQRMRLQSAVGHSFEETITPRMQAFSNTDTGIFEPLLVRIQETRRTADEWIAEHPETEDGPMQPAAPVENVGEVNNPSEASAAESEVPRQPGLTAHPIEHIRSEIANLFVDTNETSLGRWYTISDLASRYEEEERSRLLNSVDDDIEPATAIRRTAEAAIARAASEPPILYNS